MKTFILLFILTAPALAQTNLMLNPYDVALKHCHEQGVTNVGPGAILINPFTGEFDKFPTNATKPTKKEWASMCSRTNLQACAIWRQQIEDRKAARAKELAAALLAAVNEHLTNKATADEVRQATK